MNRLSLITPLLCAYFSLTCAEKFLWGSATASYQIEGAATEGGRGSSVWDTFSHIPGKTSKGDTGDIADDHYHRWKDDLKLLKNMNVTAYRFSISWTRILPTGTGSVNQAGIDFYNNIIDALVEYNIVPLVTLFHWDTPSDLENKYGGWLSPSIQDDFAAYSDVAFKAFGDRVKHWITINEPMTVALVGYSQGVHAPGRCSDRSRCDAGDSSTEPYIVTHNMLNGHAKVVEIYRNKYQATQKGVIGITLNSDFAYPLTGSPEDAAAAQRNMEFQAGWFADPVFFGHYPQSMVDSVGSRLPKFTAEEQARIKGSWDFYGLNHYTSKYAANKAVATPSSGWDNDQGTLMSNTDVNGNLIGLQAASGWLNVVPTGIHDMLKWVSARYSNPPILVTENGCDVPGESQMSLDQVLQDDFRINYYSGYLNNLLAAVAEGVNVRGYFAWSFMDNFEWADGYDYRFGLHYVDYTDLKRYPKASAKWFTKFIEEHSDL